MLQATSCSTGYRSEKIDNLCLSLAEWNWERSSVPTKENIQSYLRFKKNLADFDKELERTRPMKRSKDTFLHLGNAIPHQAPQDFDRLGIARFPHLPYSQGLASCDLWLFGTLKRKLEGSTFGDQIEVLLPVNTIFSTIPREEFISVFDE
jgi:hypothetical protein